MVTTSYALCVAVLLFFIRGNESQGPRQVFSWNQLDYIYPNQSVRNEVFRNNGYLPRSNLPLGMEIWRNRVFFTIPRRRAGVPVTLAYVRLSGSANRSPALTPYPNWEMNDPGRIASAYRLKVDSCDRLWVIDAGRADLGFGFQRIAQPQILIFDLNRDELLYSYYFPQTVYTDTSFHANIAVDITTSCNNAFAYVPDLGGNALVVFSLRDNDAWRIDHSYFSFDPLSTDYNIAGLNYQLKDGAFGVALSEIERHGFRTLYFHSLSSFNEFSVSTRILRNKTIANRSFHSYNLVGTRGINGQSTGSVYDESTGVLFFMEVHRHRVSCWNTKKGPLFPNSLGTVAQAFDNTFLYPSDPKIDRFNNLWFLNNNLPVYFFGTIDLSVPNYFVYFIPIDEAIRGTPCDVF